MKFPFFCSELDVSEEANATKRHVGNTKRQSRRRIRQDLENAFKIDPKIDDKPDPASDPRKTMPKNGQSPHSILRAKTDPRKISRAPPLSDAKSALGPYLKIGLKSFSPGGFYNGTPPNRALLKHHRRA